MAYSILSNRFVALRLAIRTVSTSNSVADKSAARMPWPTWVMYNLSRSTRVVSNLSMARGMSSSILRAHQKIGPPQVVLLHLDGKLLHEKG